MGKRVSVIDKHVGSRVRQRRTTIGMSQQTLGDAIGVTFQQVQKYEKGVNRIGAGRLQTMAQVMAVPVAYFYENASYPKTKIADVRERISMSTVNSFLASKHGPNLANAFVRIRNQQVRRSIVALVEKLAQPAGG